MKQNTKITLYKIDKIQNDKIKRQQNENFDIANLGPHFPIENQRTLIIFYLVLIVFCCFCISVILNFDNFAFCYSCNLFSVYLVT